MRELCTRIPRTNSLTVVEIRGCVARGGFVNVAFQLSRIFKADAGRSLQLDYAYDEANAHDLRTVGNTRQENDLAAGTLTYKLNSLVSFV